MKTNLIDDEFFDNINDILHHSHPTYSMTQEERAEWWRDRGESWTKRRNKKVREMVESGLSLNDVYRSNVSGMFFQELKDFVVRHKFETPQQREARRLRSTIPRWIERTLSDDQILEFSEARDSQVDDLLTLAIVQLNSATDPKERVAMQRVVAQYLKIRIDAQERDDQVPIVNLSINTRRNDDRPKNDDENN